MSLLIVSSALTAKEMNENQRHTGKIAEGVNSSPTISVLNINNHDTGLVKIVHTPLAVVIMVHKLITQSLPVV